MKYIYYLCMTLVILSFHRLGAQNLSNQNDAIIVNQIFKETLANSEIPEHLRVLSKEIGNRMAGTMQAKQAIKWIELQLHELNADSVYLQPVQIPVWIRGEKEKAFMMSDKWGKQVMSVLALGNSVGTDGVLNAEVVEIRSWEQLKAMPDEHIKGKFVFYNRPMDPTKRDPFDAYVEAVDQRGIGAIEAAKKGAIGALVRSLTMAIDDYPHTGAMQYADHVKKIPAAALSTLAADRLSAALDENPHLKFSLEMHCSTLPDIISHNVIAEIKGSTHPDEYVTIGAHTDTWDVGEGASDDATGIAQTIEALRVFKTLELKPKRSIRFIFYMNEESGAHGGEQYANEVERKNEMHLASIESDAGGFQPVGFRFSGASTAMSKIEQYSTLLVPYGIGQLKEGHRGVDIAPMKDLSPVLLSLDCESHRLFDIHHSALDTLETLNFREVGLGAAAMATMAYLISENGLK